MYAITLHQPWVSLIALGIKSVEAQSWPAPATWWGRPSPSTPASGWSGNRAFP